jgi:hypothetical protein
LPTTKEINEIPAVWNSDSIPLIVVGAAASDFTTLPATQYKPSAKWPQTGVDLFAPGQDIICNFNQAGDWAVSTSGTSIGNTILASLSSLIMINLLTNFL